MLRKRAAVLAAAALLVVATVTAAITTGGAHPSGEAARVRALGTPAGPSGAAPRAAAAGPLLHLPTVDLATLSAAGIPAAARSSYRLAAQQTAGLAPSCHLRWWLLAAIGFVESDHAAAGGSTRPGWDGMARPPILGPVLDGTRGYPRIADTDHGFFDGNKRWDRAVGPMQFLPSAWARWGGRGPLSGHADPQDLYVAALAAGRYLCAGGVNLSAPPALRAAVLAYNPSPGYPGLVLSVAARYAGLAPSALGASGAPVRATPHPSTAGSSSAPAAPGAPGPTPRPSSSPSATSPQATTSPRPSPSPSSSGPLPLPTITRPAG